MTNGSENGTMEMEAVKGEDASKTVGVFHLKPEYPFHGHVATAEDDHRQCVCHDCVKDRHALVDGKD